MTSSNVQQRYSARHHVMVDDKLRILAAMKEIPQDQLTAVFPRQGHYALDRRILSTYPPADPAIERIGNLFDCEFSAWFRPARAVDKKQETT